MTSAEASPRNLCVAIGSGRSSARRSNCALIWRDRARDPHVVRPGSSPATEAEYKIWIRLSFATLRSCLVNRRFEERESWSILYSTISGLGTAWNAFRNFPTVDREMALLAIEEA